MKDKNEATLKTVRTKNAAQVVAERYPYSSTS